MRRLLPALLLLTPGLFGYVRLNLCEVTGSACPGVPLQRTDNAGIQYLLNNLIAPGLTSNASGSNITVITANSNPQQAIGLAQSAWNQVTTANVKYLPVQSTTRTHDPQDCLDVISVAASPSEISVVTGVIAITVNVSVSSAGVLACDTGTNVNAVPGNLVDSDILLNPAYSFSTDGSTFVDLQGIMTHEFGHTLGADHTALLGATMFQYGANSTQQVAYTNQRFLSADDLAFVNAAYPAAGAAATGTISGTITGGGTGVPYALLTFIDTNQGITVGGIANLDGTYSQSLPPGNYLVYAEPFNAIVTPSHLYFTEAQTTAANSVSFGATFFGGNSSPTTVPLTANSTVSGTNITVNTLTSGQAPLALPLVGFGKAGGSGDIVNLNGIGGPISVSSGQSFDIGFLGTGFDSSLALSNILVYGPGITATHIGVDSGVTFRINGVVVPLVRLTVTITGQQTANVATIFITKGTAASTLALTALLAITPPTPGFISASLVSAATLAKAPSQGAVSPGGIYALFAPQGSPANLGPGNLVINSGYVNNFLPTLLGGVRVTFDGIGAPLFFAASGQINLQVPFEIAGKTSTNVVVSFFGAASPAVAVGVVNEQPAFFTLTGDGQSDSIVVNLPSESINSSSNPAPRGSYVTAYGTGLGNVTGLVTGQSAPNPATALNYTCAVGSIASTGSFNFVGWTPASVGLAQFQFQVPANSPASSKQTLTCTDNATGVSTETGTIYIGS